MKVPNKLTKFPFLFYDYSASFLPSICSHLVTEFNHLRFLSAESLPEEVIEEGERAWGKVVAAVKTTFTQHSHVLSPHFLPFGVDIGKELHKTREGESRV